ncbi:hypothetical protein EsH8_III_001530 [Colletotrichum jinshuiense]
MVNIISLKGLLLTLGATTIARAGFLDEGCGYLGDGPDFTLREDGSVTTYCNDKICNEVIFTVINLNDCIANVLGDLKPKANPHYKETFININEVLDNWNGYLRCHNAISDCLPVPWKCMPKHWWPEGSPPTILTTDCDIWI